MALLILYPKILRFWWISHWQVTTKIESHVSYLKKFFLVGNRHASFNPIINQQTNQSINQPILNVSWFHHLRFKSPWAICQICPMILLRNSWNPLESWWCPFRNRTAAQAHQQRPIDDCLRMFSRNASDGRVVLAWQRLAWDDDIHRIHVCHIW